MCRNQTPEDLIRPEAVSIVGILMYTKIEFKSMCIYRAEGDLQKSAAETRVKVLHVR